MADSKLTAERVRELLDYDPETGIIRWRGVAGAGRGRGRSWAGVIAGWKVKSGYISIHVGGRSYRAHQLAWLHYYGEWPVKFLDHRDHQRDNNRIGNLREADNRINNENRIEPLAKKDIQLMGAYANHGLSTFRACIQARGRFIHLGCFDTAEEAHAAYLCAKRKLHDGWVPDPTTPVVDFVERRYGPRRKLTDEQIRLIRESNEPQRILAARFGVCGATIWKTQARLMNKDRG